MGKETTHPREDGPASPMWRESAAGGRRRDEGLGVWGAGSERSLVRGLLFASKGFKQQKRPWQMSGKREKVPRRHEDWPKLEHRVECAGLCLPRFPAGP